jgi:hypothetical protein
MPRRGDSGQLPGFKPGEMKVRIWGGPPREAQTGFAIEGRSPDGNWCARAFLAVDQDQHLAITRLELWPFDTAVVMDAAPRIGLGGDDLRRLPLGRWLSEALAQLADENLVGKTGAGYDPLLEELGYTAASAERREWARQVAGEAQSVKLRRGRRGYPDDHYRRIALAYLDLQRHGVSRGIQKRLAEQEGRPWQTIRDWLRIATEKGFLTKGTKGRAGRMAGPHLYEATQQKERQ